MSRRRQRGAVAVETVVIAPLLLLLVFGVIEFGFLLYVKHTVSQTSRDAVRLSATQSKQESDEDGDGLFTVDLETESLQLVENQIENVRFGDVVPQKLVIYGTYVTNKAGDTTDSEIPRNEVRKESDIASCTSYCAVYQWNPDSETFVKQSGSTDWIVEQQRACLDVRLGQDPDAVGVYLQTEYRNLTPFMGFLSGKKLSSTTVMRLEPVAEGKCDYGETATP